MSVYVDRLPDCCDCCVCNDDYWKCGINRESISHDGRREDCPLIEIVHCKDCEFCIVEEPISRGIIPDVYCRIWESNVSTDDYCSYGERKLKNPDDSLVSEDSEDVKEQESKLESDLISRQAAIEALETMRHIWARHIRAIESLPPVTHGRLIDADKLLQEFFNVGEEEWTTPEIRAILKNAPPVEPEQRPRGEWKYGNGNGECPFCGRERQLGWDNFCGFCGADMRGNRNE